MLSVNCIHKRFSCALGSRLLHASATYPDSSILGVYNNSALLANLFAAMESKGIDINNLHIDDLAAVDQFHIGGVEGESCLC